MALETIAVLFTEGLLPYPEAERQHDRTRLIRLVDAKKMLRLAAVNIDGGTASVWRLVIAGAMQYAGESIIGFASGLKGAVKKASLLDRVIKWKTGTDSAIAPVAQKYAAFFGVRTEIGAGALRTVVKWVTPAQDKAAEEVVVGGLKLINARKLAELVDRGCTGGNPSRRNYYLQAWALKARPSCRRKWKTARSRKPGKK